LPFLKDENIGCLLKEGLVKVSYSIVSTMNKSTSEQYLSILNIFNNFLNKELNGLAINGLVNKFKEGSADPYNILSRYCSYLVNSGNISAITSKQRVITIKNFFEYCNIDINPRKFKLKVKLPKI
jgi:hypothetical protein